MEQFSFFVLSVMFVLVDNPADPIFAAWQGRQAVRNLDCSSLTQTQAHGLYPTLVPEPARRTQTLTDIDAQVCRQRLVAWGQRPPRDELILDSLTRSSGELAQAASAWGTKDTHWYVDAFYPDADVSTRIAAATRTELVQRGAQVSNGVPLLAAGDLLVMRDLDVAQAFPLACARYAAEHTLASNEAFLAVVLVDARESDLHAGVCHDGHWQWLR